MQSSSVQHVVSRSGSTVDVVPSKRCDEDLYNLRGLSAALSSDRARAGGRGARRAGDGRADRGSHVQRQHSQLSAPHASHRTAERRSSRPRRPGDLLRTQGSPHAGNSRSLILRHGSRKSRGRTVSSSASSDTSGDERSLRA